MKENIIKILLLVLVSCFVLLFTDYKSLGEFYFYFLIVIIGFNFIITKNLTLLSVWNTAFLFIILSEVFSLNFTSLNSKLPALKFLIIANNLIMIGYLSNFKRSNFLLSPLISKKPNTSKIAPKILILLVLIYFVLQIGFAFQKFRGGRSVEGLEESFILSAILGALGFILPATLAYYYIFVKRTKIFTPFLISLPVFLIIFLSGSRFPLLFSFMGFIIVAKAKIYSKMNFKNYLTLGGAIFLLLLASIAMKQLRSSTSNNREIIFFNDSTYKDLPTFFSKNASPEGVIDMTNLMFNYFNNNDFLYGQSSSFILYFWVPRSIWPEKPTMIGHWLIRDFRGGFSSGHSASFGFTGDLYADFGKYSLILVFFLGRFLKFGENFKNWALKSNSYFTILGAMTFPYVFFFVRSPITASMNFLGILFFYFFIKRLIFSR